MRSISRLPAVLLQQVAISAQATDAGEVDGAGWPLETTERLCHRIDNKLTDAGRHCRLSAADHHVSTFPLVLHHCPDCSAARRLRLALIVGGAAGTAISYHDRRTTGIQADDETAEWKGAIAFRRRIATTANVNFTSFNRILLVSGGAGRIGPQRDWRNGRGIEGTRQVHNELQIAPPTTLGSRSNDVFISSKFKLACSIPTRCQQPHRR